jgi:hypothetical protein
LWKQRVSTVHLGTFVLVAASARAAAQMTTISFALIFFSFACSFSALYMHHPQGSSHEFKPEDEILVALSNCLKSCVPSSPSDSESGSAGR